MTARPFGLRAYQGATALLAPVAHGVLAWRRARGKEESARLQERWGFPSLARPAGELVWLHGASVGEIALAWEAWRRFAPLYPQAQALFTTGTQTSARWLAMRAPRALHQYLPLDSPRAVARFVAYWHPQLAVFFESDLWPNLLQAAKNSGTRLALLNARMSPRSLAGWARWPATARAVFGGFDLIQSADAALADAIEAFGGRVCPAFGNLKNSAQSLPGDEAQLAVIRAALGRRPVWIAASTHAGEDEIVLAAHAILRQQSPDALCIIVPRHPERGARIAELAGKAPRRALGEAPSGPVYVADTVGELGLFYRVCPVALIGGALTPAGRGHNPFEALALGCATLTGPHVSSFQDVMNTLIASGAVARVHDANELAASVASLWQSEAKRAAMTAAAQAVLTQAEAVWQALLTELTALAQAARSHATP